MICRIQIRKGLTKFAAMIGIEGFEGGGFTGHGARTGGVDGRGGFPAILHPNETVIDHTKGQQAGQQPGVTSSAMWQTRRHLHMPHPRAQGPADLDRRKWCVRVA